MKKQAILWLKGLTAATVGGAASAGLLVVALPDKFQWSDLSGLGRVAAAGGLISALFYLKRSPLWNGSETGGQK